MKEFVWLCFSSQQNIYKFQVKMPQAYTSINNHFFSSLFYIRHQIVLLFVHLSINLSFFQFVKFLPSFSNLTEFCILNAFPTNKLAPAAFHVCLWIFWKSQYFISSRDWVQNFASARAYYCLSSEASINTVDKAASFCVHVLTDNRLSSICFYTLYYLILS